MPPITTADIDRRATLLIEEFREHVVECQTLFPDMTDERRIFEGWAIQKIASLQLIVLAMEERWKALAR